MNIRIISGTLGGRMISSPQGHKTHPMSEKMRGAIFNILGDITELEVFDPFAGSGALSIEAVSRGAREVTAIDSDKNAFLTVLKNVTALQLQHVIKVSRANVRSWLENNSNERFDIVLCDPPYDKISFSLLKFIAEHTAINGIIVFSLPPDATIELGSEFSKVTDKQYGDARLVFYRRLG